MKKHFFLPMEVDVDDTGSLNKPGKLRLPGTLFLGMTLGHVDVSLF